MKKIKSDSFLASIGGGIKKAARWVARMFGYKAENKFARGVWYVFAICVTIIALIFTTVFIVNFVDLVKDSCEQAKRERMVNSPTYLHEDYNEYVSPYVIFHNWCPSYLYNMKTGRRTLTGIHEISKSSDGDSLICYCTLREEGHKHGYFNRFTGEVVIPAQYDNAWGFSEGLACVYEKGTLHFIDHSGQSVMDKDFPYTERNKDYCFHNGLCLMLGDNERIGLIDHQGNWVVDPQYYQMSYDKKGFWIVNDSDWNCGLLDAKGKMLLPVAYDIIDLNHIDSSIFVRRLDHLEQVLDFDCNVINPCNYAELEKLEYCTYEFDKYGNLKYVSSNCMSYRTKEYRYGLMDLNGNMLTPPIYFSIIAIGSDRFHCDGPNGSVILDSKGVECGEKL